jgi:diguanylate cyclase (GGDEF)-like protein/PAS domain S-box-containing protein
VDGGVIVLLLGPVSAAVVAAAIATIILVRRADRRRSLDDRRYALLETLPDALIIVDDTWHFTHVNERAEALLRRTAADLVGQRVDRILDPLASELFPEMQRARKAGTPVEFVQEFALGERAVEVRVQPSIGETLVYLRDVTESRNAERRLREGERRLRLLLQQVPAVVWSADLDMRVTSASGTALADYALSESEVLGRSVDAVFAVSGNGAYTVSFLERVFAGESVRYETCANQRWLQHDVEPLRGNDGRIVGAIGAALDVTDIKQGADQLRRQARSDQLTGLPNRLALEETLDAMLTHAQQQQCHLAVMFLDLDRFKIINDTLGHRAGDALLRDVAFRLTSLLAGRAHVFRSGGDEFVILSETGEPHDVQTLATEILEAFDRSFTFEGRELHITASIGASLYPDNATHAEDLIKQADSAMYRAKDAGRKNAKFYSTAMHVRIVERMGLELDLRQALAREEFTLLYQPMVDLVSEEIVGAEALLRWRHPSLGTLSPDRFIDIAEEIGIIVDISDWVIAQACAHAASTRRLGFPTFRIAINVSARDLCLPNFTERLTAVLAHNDLTADAVDIEITEGVTVNELAVKTLVLLQQMGVRIVVDDFGIGYSSLDYIRRLPVGAIKIDKSFLAEVVHSHHDQAIVKAIATLAETLGIGIVAEGVETAGQRELLVGLRVPTAQGFYYSRPIPPTHFTKLMQTKQLERIDVNRRRVVNLVRGGSSLRT